jgi:hypothetical protein
MRWEFESRTMSNRGVRDSLRKFGFAVIRNAFDPKTVSRIRSQLDEAFASAEMRDRPTMCSTEVLRRESIWRMLFDDGIVSSLRAALGPELFYQHDVDVQRNSYGLTGWKRNTGWHMDAGSEAGNFYLRAPDYRFVKCGIFLQDFDNGWGGGIRIKPKSHRGLSEPNKLKRTLFYFKRALNRIAMMLRMDVGTFEVPTRAGDFCFFDSRLLHSSTPPDWENILKIGYDRKPNICGFWPDIPKECTKYVIYWDACNAAMVDDFLRNSIKRSESEQEGMIEHSLRPAIFTRILAMSYPDDFPQAFVAAANERDVRVASLGRERAAFYKQKLQTMQLIDP